MLNPRWSKVARDLWLNKSRTMLITLSIMIGCFAVGTVAHMQLLVSRDLVESYESVNPAQVIIATGEGFDENLVAYLRKQPNVSAVEARSSHVLRFRGPGEETWSAMRFFALNDYEDISVNIVRPEQEFAPGPENWPEPDVWPPPNKALVLERTSLLLDSLGLGMKVQQGDTIEVELYNGKIREVPMAGLAYDFSQRPATFAGIGYAYVTFDTLEWLGLPRTSNELHLIVDSAETDWATLKQRSLELRRTVEDAGYPVLKVDVPEPGKLPLDSLFSAITLVLGAMGVFSLFLAIFLIINTISAIVAQQVRQIGVMKAIGGRTPQLMRMYLSMVFIFGLLSLIIALPLAAFTAQHAINVIAYFINFNLSGFELRPEVMLLQAAVALLVPLLAAVVPVLRGTRTTVREAMSSHGNEEAETKILDGILSLMPWIGRPMRLSLRNTFRRKGRLGLTLLTLSLASAVVIAVFSVRSSLFATLDQSFAQFSYDAGVQFGRDYRFNQVEHLVMQTPGVEVVESWQNASTYRHRPDGSESEAFGITGLPYNSPMIAPEVVEGRWLNASDSNGMVVSQALINAEALAVGDSMVLEINGKERSWQVVGVVETIGGELLAYAPLEPLSRALSTVGMTNQIQVLFSDSAEITPALETIEAQLSDAGFRVQRVFTQDELRAQSGTFFNIIVTLLMIMAALMVVVGALGLTGTMSLNVLERTREIGVMRAVGATNATLLKLFIVEGVLIGLMSWVIGAAVAFPGGQLLSQVIGIQFIESPLTFDYSITGAVGWLVALIVVAIVATYFPANRAAQMTVREVLSYE